MSIAAVKATQLVCATLTILCLMGLTKPQIMDRRYMK